MRKPSGIFDLISSAWTAFEIRFSFVFMKKIRLKFFLMKFFFVFQALVQLVKDDMKDLDIMLKGLAAVEQ